MTAGRKRRTDATSRMPDDGAKMWLNALKHEPRLIVLLVFLIVCALGGGVARWDAWQLIYVRAAAVVAIGVLIILPGQWDWRGLRMPSALLILFAASIAIQLIPLPPSVWPLLPGRHPYLQAALLADVPQPWRPISLVPQRTVNSLLATLPAFAGLIALAGITRMRWHMLGDAIILLCCVSALLGVLQFGTGILYPYHPSDIGMPIGLLANRNHQALLLVIGIVLLAEWGMRNNAAPAVRGGIALAIVLLLTSVILLTGSRTGLALMVIAIGIVTVAATIYMRRSAWRSPLRFALMAAPFVMIVLGAYIAQNSSFVRLSNSIDQIDGDMRILALPTTLKMAWTYFPIGAGFGTFDILFMQFEPDDLVKRTFFNRAHNDPLEVMITGGLPALMIVGAFLFWFARRILALRTSTDRSGRHRSPLSLRRAAVLSVAFALIASVVDYPLRTPLIALIFIMLCGLSLSDLPNTTRTPPPA